MGFFERLHAEMHVPGADGVRILDVPSVMNLRELGGYETPDGPTRAHRFLRCGSTRCIMQRDRAFLREYGLTHVLDLRSSAESPALTCPYARDRSVVWKNIPLFGHNLSDPALVSAQKTLDYLAGGYLSMLGNHYDVRHILNFLASVPQDECVLFHCAAGMDRTGVLSMLLLGLAGVSRRDIIKDYLYSFAPVPEVDQFVDNGELAPELATSRLAGRFATIGRVYDAVIDAYGSVAEYARACEVTDSVLDRLRLRLLG